jgi:type VI protein secretion system component Hcp
VKLEIIPAGGDQRGRLVITLKNVVIAQVVQQPATGRDRATEAVTFTCESLEWESQPAAATWRASPLPHSVTPRPP